MTKPSSPISGEDIIFLPSAPARHVEIKLGCKHVAAARRLRSENSHQNHSRDGEEKYDKQHDFFAHEFPPSELDALEKAFHIEIEQIKSDRYED